MQANGGERFPLDIYANIINEIEALSCRWKTKRQCLENLSLTCRHLRPLCQKSLFRKATINFTQGFDFRDRPAQFVGLANNSPVPLARYIRELRFTLGFRRYLDNISASQFLLILENVKILHIKGHVGACFPVPERYGNPGLDWRALEQLLTSALSKVMRSPSLQSLHLEGLKNVPPGHLYWLSRDMVDLFISHLHIEEDSSRDNLLDHERKRSHPQILKYHLGPYCHSASALFHANKRQDRVFDFTHLKYLSVEWHEQLDIDDTKALLLSARKVETFSCQMQYKKDLSFQGLAEVITNGPVSTLRTLETTISWYDEGTGDQFCGLIEELTKLSEISNCLETITMTLWTRALMSKQLETQFKLLDSLFPAAFQCLQKLSIIGKVAFYYGDASEDEDFEEIFQEKVIDLEENCFPNIFASPRIDFTFEITADWK